MTVDSYKFLPKLFQPMFESVTADVGEPVWADFKKVTEDKLLQKAASRILEAIFEQDFLNNSYGYRPGGRSHRRCEETEIQIAIWKLRIGSRG